MTYSATVKDAGSRGDDVLRNSLACPAGSPAGCEPETTEHPVRTLELTKTSDATADSRPGDTVTYTVTAENTGDGAFTAADPAVIIDDLTGVLDDGTYQGDAAATIAGCRRRQHDVRRAALALGGCARGRRDRHHHVHSPPARRRRRRGRQRRLGAHAGHPSWDDTRLRGSGDDRSVRGGELDLPRLSITKAADPTEANATGDVITYTVVVTNEGPGDYTAAAPASFDDDLSDVLDDAAFVVGSPTADIGTTSFAPPVLSWTGALPAGDDATITYQVRYTGVGDQSMVNAACVPETEALDPAEDCDSVTVEGSDLSRRRPPIPLTVSRSTWVMRSPTR